jgi:hypothetical protein
MFGVERSGGGGLNCEAEECLTAVLYKIAELPTVEPPTPPPLYTEKHIWNQLVVFPLPDIRDLRFPDLDTQVPSKWQFFSNMITISYAEQQVHLPIRVRHPDHLQKDIASSISVSALK